MDFSASVVEFPDTPRQLFKECTTRPNSTTCLVEVTLVYARPSEMESSPQYLEFPMIIKTFPPPKNSPQCVISLREGTIPRYSKLLTPLLQPVKWN